MKLHASSAQRQRKRPLPHWEGPVQVGLGDGRRSFCSGGAKVVGILGTAVVVVEPAKDWRVILRPAPFFIDIPFFRFFGGEPPPELGSAPST